MSGRFGPRTELVGAFLEELGAMPHDQWRDLEASARQLNSGGMFTWDSAWEQVRLPSAAEAVQAAQGLARDRGLSLGAQALAGGAAGAVAAGHVLSRRDFETLVAPLAHLVPVEARPAGRDKGPGLPGLLGRVVGLLPVRGVPCLARLVPGGAR
ncbi:MAG: hypothetical protein ACYDAY_11755 [Candidatus Dormibacteria bacterium]